AYGLDEAAEERRDRGGRAVNGAELPRFRRGEKRLADDDRAPGGGELAVPRVDLAERDRGRRRGGERGHHGERCPHEGGPDRERGLRARQAEAVSLVEPDPHERDQPRRVADEPRVAPLVRRARLPGDRALHAERPCRGAGPAIEDALEQVRHQEGLVRPESSFSLAARLAHSTLAVHYRPQPARSNMLP